MTTCPQGHSSTATDYCDVCGDPIGVVAAQAPATPVSLVAASVSAPGVVGASKACPNCAGENPEGALFCEDCGYDFTTDQPPVVAAPNSLSLDPIGSSPAGVSAGANSSAAPVVLPMPSATGWVAELWIDPDWYVLHGVDLGEPCPSVGAPKVVGLRDSTVAIGRGSKSRNVQPGIECGLDSAVSHKHAQLLHDGDRWFVEDLGSTNGTYISVAGSPLPNTPLEANLRRELAANERIQVGAWTRIVIRTALPGE